MCLDKCLDNELEIRYALRQNGLVARTETASPDFLRIARHVGRRQGHNSERRAREAEDTAANHIDALIDRIRTPSRGTRSRWPEALQQRDHSLFSSSSSMLFPDPWHASGPLATDTRALQSEEHRNLSPRTRIRRGRGHRKRDTVAGLGGRPPSVKVRVREQSFSLLQC